MNYKEYRKISKPKRKNLEDKIQIEFIKKLSDYPFLKPAFVRNEQGYSSPQVGARLKAMGRMAGFSDLLIFDTRFQRTIYFVEMKKWEISNDGKAINRGKQSDSQKSFQELVESHEFNYFLIDSPEAEKKFFNFIDNI